MVKTQKKQIISNTLLRKAIYAGSFYPIDKKVLSKMINGFLSKANSKKIEGELKALIVPHAGYIYSGLTAAFAYKILEKSTQDRIILLGPSHYDYFKGELGFIGAWETPLGVTQTQKSDLKVIENDREHSLEVQLPFLQNVLKKFEFVPIIYGETSGESLAHIAMGLSNKKTIIIASSDLSHYNSYETAKKIDNNSINAILSLDVEKFSKDGDACGKIGIISLMLLAIKNNWTPILLDYKNSGDTTKDKKSVVGYCAIGFFKQEIEQLNTSMK